MIGADVGGAGGSKGLIRAYANSRSVPQSPDPNVPPGITSNDNWLNLMFDVGDNNEDVLDNVVGKNEAMPYDQTDYPGETFNETEIVDYAQISNTTVGGMTRLKGSTFPCGLIKLNLSEAVGTSILLVHMVPGPARGYMAQTMVDM